MTLMEAGDEVARGILAVSVTSVKLYFKEKGIRAGRWEHSNTTKRTMLVHEHGKVRFICSWGGNVRARKEVV